MAEPHRVTAAPPPGSGAVSTDHESPTLIATDLPGSGSGPRTSASTTGVMSAGAIPSAQASSERQRFAGRYEIMALVGAGGMGTVYRARDIELDEMVALKVLRPELVAAPGILDRFRREAKLARRVTHTNVARVFDIGEHEGEKFLTMELVDGESLSATLAREGAFSVSRALAVAASIAEGLGCAHAAGVVHRDLKPDNVLLARDGRVVVTDFGIARAIVDAARAGAATSAAGMLLGTPAYMAPEQVQARPEVDARADIYAFGALLYELLTGHRAWPGDSPLAVAAARLLSPPPDPRAQRPGLPDACAELVLRCMHREPSGRPASIAAVAAALAAAAKQPHRGGHLGEAPTPPPVSATAISVGAAEPAITPAKGVQAEKTVAVLPFRNAGDPADDYLAEELTDDLLDGLSMTRGLKVRARGAVLRFRGVDRDPRDVGRELGVQVVVEGSVRKARGRVRISARLVSVADGFQIWAKRFDRPEQEVLSINDEVARAIAEALTLDARALDERAREAPSNPVAIDLYLRARHEYRQFWPEHVRRSIELFEQALAVAPDDPLLLSGLSLSLSRLTYFAGDAGIARAREVAERAVAAAPQLGEAQLAHGTMLFQTGETPAAMRALRTAVARNPGLAEAHAMIGRLLAEVGTGGEAVRYFEAALALDPDTPLALPELGRVHGLLGQWEQVDQIFERVRKTTGLSVWSTARMALWRRQTELVVTYLSDLPEAERNLRVPRMLLESVRDGSLTATARDMDAMLRDPGSARRRAFLLQIRAEIAGYLRDVDETIASLRASTDAGLIDRLWLDRCPLLEDARTDPRFAPIHAEVKRRADAVLAAYRG